MRYLLAALLCLIGCNCSEFWYKEDGRKCVQCGGGGNFSPRQCWDVNATGERIKQPGEVTCEGGGFFEPWNWGEYVCETDRK